ncbi:MAG: tryptophan synthase subunit alpha [Planctomycetota bacterium]
MNRIEKTYADLKANGRAAFNVYLCAGDPDLDTTRELILAFEKAGVDIIELGMPFSDPIADGPEIQAAGQRSLDAGTTLAKVLELVADIRTRSEIPIALMTYYNVIYKFGIERFVAEAKRVGVDGLIVPDLIAEEAGELIGPARNADLATIFFVAPTSTDDRIKLADESSTGFIYCVSVTGITGARDSLPDDIREYLRAVRSKTTKPLAVGFGVSTPGQVRAMSELADGVIVGSAVVREIEAAAGLPRAELVAKVSDFVAALAAGVR